MAPPAATWRASSSRRWSCSRDSGCARARWDTPSHLAWTRTTSSEEPATGPTLLVTAPWRESFGEAPEAASSSRWSTYHTRARAPGRSPARAPPRAACARATTTSRGGRHARRCPHPRRPPARARRGAARGWGARGTAADVRAATRRERGGRGGDARRGRGRGGGGHRRWRIGARGDSYRRGRRSERARRSGATHHVRPSASLGTKVASNGSRWSCAARGGVANWIAIGVRTPQNPTVAPSGGGVCLTSGVCLHDAEGRCAFRMGTSLNFVPRENDTLAARKHTIGGDVSPSSDRFETKHVY